MEIAAAIGVSEEAFWDMLPREFYRRMDAHFTRREAEEDDRWARTLMVYNQLGFGFAGKKYKPVSLDDLKKKSQVARNAPTKEEYERDLAKIAAARQNAKA